MNLCRQCEDCPHEQEYQSVPLPIRMERLERALASRQVDDALRMKTEARPLAASALLDESHDGKLQEEPLRQETARQLCCLMHHGHPHVRSRIKVEQDIPRDHTRIVIQADGRVSLHVITQDGERIAPSEVAVSA